MHRKILFIGICTLIFHSAEAQFKGGFYFGINGSQVNGDKLSGFYKLGLNLSAAVEYPMGEHFGTSMEIAYTQKGSQTSWVQGMPRLFFLKLDYVEVPLMLNYHDNKKVTLSVGVGINALVNSFHDDPVYGYPGKTYTYPEQIKNSEVEVKAGGSYNLTKHWMINVLYSYSALAMGRSTESPYLNGGIFNNLVTFRLGYLIKGKATK